MDQVSSQNLEEGIERTRMAFRTIAGIMLRNATNGILKLCEQSTVIAVSQFENRR